MNRLRVSGSDLHSWNLRTLTHHAAKSLPRKSVTEKVECRYIEIRFSNTKTMNSFVSALISVRVSWRHLGWEKRTADKTARSVDQQPIMRTGEDRTPSAFRSSSLPSTASGNGDPSKSRMKAVFGETLRNLFTLSRLPEMEPTPSSPGPGFYIPFEASSYITRESGSSNSQHNLSERLSMLGNKKKF